MGIFNPVANLEYKGITGGLPGWVFLIIFIISLISAKSTTYTEFGSGKKEKMGWFISIMIALGSTFMAFVGDKIRQCMFKTCTCLYKRQGMNNSTANATAFQTQEFKNIGAKINGIKSPAF
jgi:hypothetical protein